MAELNQALTNETPLPGNFLDEIALIETFANHAEWHLRELFNRLGQVSRLEERHFENGRTADQLIHPPVERGRLVLVQSSANADATSDGLVTMTDWLNGPPGSDRRWGFPSGQPTINPAWPDNQWRVRLSGILRRVGPNTELPSLLSSSSSGPSGLDESDRSLLMREIDEIALGGLGVGSDDGPTSQQPVVTQSDEGDESPADEGDESPADEGDESPGEKISPSKGYLKIRIEGNNISREGKPSIRLCSRLSIKLLERFVERRNTNYPLLELTEDWEDLGGKANPTPTTITSQFTKLNQRIHTLAIKVESAGRNMGWRLVELPMKSSGD